MITRELFNLATKKLAKSKSTSPNLDAEVLLSYVLGKPKEYILINPDKKITQRLEKKYLKLLRKRALGWPMAYLTGQKEFFGLNFFVNKNVLIPRPETEELVELALSRITKHTTRNKKPLSILDVGTGSGNIIISLAQTLPGHKYFASDISSKTLVVAKKNAKLYKIRISFKQSDLLKAWKNQKFDIIIANLPYLAKQTDPSTKFEPSSSLIAKNKGLALYEKMFRQIANNNSPQFIFLEIGHDQGRPIKMLANKYLPAFEIKILRDLAARPRFAVLVKKSS